MTLTAVGGRCRGAVACLREAVAALATFGVPGRFEIIDEGQPFTLIVDSFDARLWSTC
jgi:hypothetical protein